MHVGMAQAENQPALAAGAAGLRTRPFADGELSQPEREPLLSDARGAAENQDLGELAAGERSGETPAGGLVADQWVERHEHEGKKPTGKG
jgi:hypothetical protein